MIKRSFGVLAAAIVALGLTAPKAEAVVIYDWTGTCDSGCTGQATAVLTLADSYTLGTPATTADFISFSYSSTSGSYDIPADAGLAFASATLPAVSGGGIVNLDFEATLASFSSSLPFWFSEFLPDGIEDNGFEHVWTLRQTQELSAPGPLSLLALGLAGLALAGRRRGKAAT